MLLHRRVKLPQTDFLQMTTITFNTHIQKFDKQGEKTGWTYIAITQADADTLHPGNRKSFRVKGYLDNHAISHVALLPMGDGSFIMPLNAAMRKAIGKKKGASIEVTLELDLAEKKLSKDLITCLKEEPKALKQFKSLPPSHQKYFSNWIESAKTNITRDKRIAMSVNAMLKKIDYGTMIREEKAKRDLLH